MENRTYPREWFKVTTWNREPEPRMFDRETEHMLFHSGGRERKWTDFNRWYPTREEAQSAIDVRERNYLARKASQRVKDAAPELLEALLIVTACGDPDPVSLYDEEDVEGWRWHHPDGREWCEIGDWGEVPMHPAARAAIAKATEPEAA